MRFTQVGSTRLKSKLLKNNLQGLRHKLPTNKLEAKQKIK